MPQYAVLILTATADRGEGADPALREPADRHADELAASGAMLVAYAFAPAGEARSIRASGVVHGPFVTATTSVAGVYVLEAADLEAAVAVARRNPAVRSATGGVEVRRVESGGVVRG